MSSWELNKHLKRGKKSVSCGWIKYLQKRLSFHLWWRQNVNSQQGMWGLQQEHRMFFFFPSQNACWSPLKWHTANILYVPPSGWLVLFRHVTEGESFIINVLPGTLTINTFAWQLSVLTMTGLIAYLADGWADRLLRWQGTNGLFMFAWPDSWELPSKFCLLQNEAKMWLILATSGSISTFEFHWWCLMKLSNLV